MFWFTLFRFVTQVVSEHWLNYKQYCTDVLGETFETQSVAKDITQAQTFTLQRLQVEFDQFLLKVSKKIVSSGRYFHYFHMKRHILFFF